MTAADRSGAILPIARERAGFDRLVEAVVANIPLGRVMTYGQIAALIPAPRSIDPVAYARVRARWAGYALGRCADDVPWHRVVNASGKPSERASGGHLPQPALLAQEDVNVDDRGAVDLATYRWQPNATALRAIQRRVLRQHADDFVQ